MMSDATQNTDLNWRRFEDGNQSSPEWIDKIHTAGHSHQCPTYVHRTPPCQGSCPSGHDIRGWLSIARGIDKPPVEGMTWQQYAFNRMVEANPFPATMGRVCPAPCEDGCNRNEVDGFVGINAVEQYVGDWAIENNLKLDEPKRESGKKVAVIGGGPAGLSAAFQLRREGHNVIIFDAHAKLGGMMRYGIPGYRTPREMVDAEVQRILDLGVETRMETQVGSDISVKEIDAEFDAVFWAIGAQTGRPLPVPGGDAENCISGVAFLEAFNKGHLQFASKKVVVVGGGDTSIDVASVARRIGHILNVHEKDRPENVVLGHTAHDIAGTMKREGVDAVLTSLFPIEEMTAAEREREDAEREGVDLKGGVMPLEVVQDENGRATALRMCECDMEGIKPIPREDTEFEIPCDIIVSAIGQMGDMTGLEDFDNGKGFIETDNLFSVVDKEAHFAGGDIIKPHLLTTAIGQGRVAADSINNFLAGDQVDKRPKVDVFHFNLLNELVQRELEPEAFDHTPTRGTAEEDFAIHNYEDRSATQIIPHDDMFLGHFQYDARNRRPETHISEEEVLGNFEERIHNLTEEEAQAEGNRCMSCGMCFECNNCIVYCPQVAVFKVKKDEAALGRYVDTDYTKCIGCKICADVCPSGYIQMGLGE